MTTPRPIEERALERVTGGAPYKSTMDITHLVNRLADHARVAPDALKADLHDARRWLADLTYSVGQAVRGRPVPADVEKLFK